MPRTNVETLPPFLARLADSGDVSPMALAKTALRYEYADIENVLARIASAGTLSAADIERAAASPDTADITAMSSSGMYALAYLVIGREIDELTTVRAADLFALARRVAERDGTANEHGDLDLQVNVRAGRLDYVRRHLDQRDISPWVRWATSTDLLHAGSDSAAWLTAFNEPFVRRGIAPVQIADPRSPFDSVHTEAKARSVHGPLVSIVMPVFSPSPSLVTAVRSLVQQTWANLQVIMVDDASPAEYAPVFAEAQALDERVEYVRMASNGGAYRARNHGVSLATGELVGFQDADDWSHPERIERQMRLLDSDPTIVATLSKAIRLYDDLHITKIGSFPFEKNAPSLLFRRHQVVDRLGRYDDLRKAADTEFIERIAAVYGPGSVVTLEEPLALYQLTDGSLSRADFRIGWHRAARVSYHAGLRHWHRSIVRDGAEPIIEGAGGRAFPAPPEFLGVPYPDEPLDIAVLADWRAGIVEHTGLPAEVEALAKSGLRIGLTRGEALRHAAVKRSYPRAAILDVLAAGHASWAPLGVDLAPTVLLVRDPQLVAVPRVESAVAMRPTRVIVVADQAPGTTYGPTTVERVVGDTFGHPTEWLPASQAIADALRTAGAAGVIHPARLTEVATPTRFPFRPREGRPVVGICDGSQFAVDRADRSGLLHLFPDDGRHDVRLLEQPNRTSSHADRSWLGFAPGMLSATEFLDQCDFYVGLPAKAGANLLRPILDAMSRGCVPIVHASYAPQLGESALYYGDRSVATIVNEVWGDPASFAARQGAALTFCHNEISGGAFASAMTQLLSADLS